jgi:regulator of protease activity HflC (stomatin/prohibitin superfamily)
MGGFIVVIVLAFLVILIVAKTAVVVPQQSAFVVERLGKYSGTLSRRLSYTLSFPRRGSLQTLFERTGHRHPAANLHHAR